MRTELLRLLWCAATAAAVLPSQNTTVPASMAGIEGGSSSNVPFGSNLACRYQCLFDAAELPWTGPRAITGISLRADNGTPTAAGAAIAQKQFLDVTVLLSTTYQSAATASGTFDENYGEDVTEVLTLARISLPAQPVVPVVPRAADIDLMFPTPWFFGLTPARGSQPAPANLLVEILVTAQPSGAYRLDNFGGCSAAAQDFGNQGPACTVPGAAGLPTLTTDASMLAGSNFSWTLTNAPPNALFLVSINLVPFGNLGGSPLLPLPFPLFDPNNPSLPNPLLPQLRWPAPDCWLNVNPAAGLTSTCDATGRGVLTTPLPPGRQYVGTTLYGQALVLAQTANPLQLVTTLGRQSTICGPLGVARVYQFYNGTGTPTPAPPTTGAVQFGSGLLLEVH